MSKKIVMLIMAVILSFSFCACGGGGEGGGGEKIDKSRKQVYVGNFDGGMGSEWMDQADNAFEAAYPEYQVIVDKKKLEYNGAKLASTMQTNRQDIYFTTEANYFDFISEGLLEDITDVVQEKTEEIDGVKTSIEDKMEPSLKKYFNKDGKYYAIPFFTAVYGIVYDKDVFEENFLFGLEDYSTQFGVDGIEGTYDDGLPATWNDFTILMKQMLANGITPFTWANMTYYRTAMLKAIWANYEGYDDYLLNYSFNGEHSTLGKIDNQNGYLLQNQGGKKAALKAAYDIMNITVSKKNCYSSRVTGSSQSNIAAQEEFIASKLITNSATKTTTPIAMMFEGGWWENEARGAFDDLTYDYGEENGYGKRNFGYMPMPRFVGVEGIPDQVNTNPILYSDIESSVFISKYSKRKDIAKKFLQFTTTNAVLSNCTKVTGVVRPYKFTMTDAQKSEMTNYGREMYNLYTNPNAKLVTGYNLSVLRRDNASYFSNWDFGATIKGVGYTDPIEAFSINKGYDFLEYANQGISKYNEASWKKMLEK